MSIDITVSEDVTNLTVTDSGTTLNVTPSTTTIALQNISIAQANDAAGISYSPAGHLSAETVQGALDEIGNGEEFTTAQKNKLESIEEEADVTDTDNVVDALSAGNNISIETDGTINANVLGAITAGNNISISETGEISASSISLTDVFTADSESEHLSLSPTPDQGDVVIRTDENKTYIHNGGTAGTMSDYTELASSSGVQSINGQAGIVTFGKTNLDGYNANEFIDWTSSNQTQIHADNYINTTYTAGDNITIDANNVISSSASGGINFSAVGNLELNDQNELNTKDVIDIDTIRFTDADGSYSNIYMQVFDNTGAFSGLGDGIVVWKDNGEGNIDDVIVAFLEGQFEFGGTIHGFTGLKAGSAYVAQPTQSIPDGTLNTAFPEVQTTGEPAVLPSELDHTNFLFGMKGVFKTQPTGDSSYYPANTRFVQEAINNLGIPSIPPNNSNQKTYVYKNSDDTYEINYLHLSPRFTTYGGTDVVLYLYDNRTELPTDEFVTKIIAGTGVTVQTDSDYNLIVSANTDGLPTQTSNLNGYVLQTNGTVANWQDLTIASLPDQSGAAGKYLKSVNGAATWSDVDAYPDQTSQDGKFLRTNNGSVEWADVGAIPDQDSDTYDKFLASSESGAVWANTQTNIPAQSTHNGKYLTTDGSTLSWATINTAGQTGNIEFSTSTISSNASNTVTIDDKLTTTGTLTAPELAINGAGSPQISSITSFKVNAADGFYVNDVRLREEALPKVHGKIEITSNIGSVTNFAGVGTVNVTKLTSNSFDWIQLQIPAFATTTNDDWSVSAVYNQSSNANTPPSNISVSVGKSYGGYVFISLRDVNGNSTGIPAGQIKITAYEI